DNGTTWTSAFDVGASKGLKATTFSSVVAGDDDRAAVAFLGSTATGDPFSSGYSGTWHLYVAVTYDAGNSWTTVQVTTDPVQKGWICTVGISCSGGRNLLDFIDATIESDGRILVAYADGCTGTCVTGSGASSAQKGTIARQTGGSTLFAVNDPAGAGAPLAPHMDTPTSGSGTVNLSWSTPFNNGAAISAYKVYRNGTLYATLGVVNSYSDTGGIAGVTYTYQVSAVNSVGEGGKSNSVTGASVGTGT